MNTLIKSECHFSDYPVIHVHPPHHLAWRDHRYRCALGWGGLSKDKFEGDGTTPVGQFPLRRVFYRPDRIAKPNTILPIHALSLNDAWCDDPSHRAYNQLVTRPFSASHECLWREDNVYDLIVEIGYNDAPVIAGKGSAIFIHISRPAYSSTRGCIALLKEDLLNLIETCRPKTNLIISAPG